MKKEGTKRITNSVTQRKRAKATIKTTAKTKTTAMKVIRGKDAHSGLGAIAEKGISVT